VGEGGVEGDAEELDLLGRQNAAPINAGGHRHECVRPAGIDRDQRLPRRVPLSDRFHLIYRWRCDRRGRFGRDARILRAACLREQRPFLFGGLAVRTQHVQNSRERIGWAFNDRHCVPNSEAISNTARA
jgi:hypothetical protein